MTSKNQDPKTEALPVIVELPEKPNLTKQPGTWNIAHVPAGLTPAAKQPESPSNTFPTPTPPHTEPVDTTDRSTAPELTTTLPAKATKPPHAPLPTPAVPTQAATQPFAPDPRGFAVLFLVAATLAGVAFGAALLLQRTGVISPQAVPTATVTAPTTAQKKLPPVPKKPKNTKSLAPAVITEVNPNQATAVEPLERSVRVSNPAGNITCDISPHGAWCSIVTNTGGDGHPKHCAEGQVSVAGVSTTPQVLCGAPLPAAETVNQDDSVSHAGYHCIAGQNTMHCKRIDGPEGFSMSPEAIRVT